MKLHGTSLRLLAGLVILAGAQASPAAAAGGQFAGGHGNLLPGGELRTFSFAVTTTEDGTPTGYAEVKNRSLNIRLLIEIDCVKFEAGNRAIMSGTITQSSDHGQIVPGRVAVFGVEDNGEGSNATEDRITTIPDYAAPKSCHEFTFVDATLRDTANLGTVVRPLNPILSGGIQVRQ